MGAGAAVTTNLRNRLKQCLFRDYSYPDELPELIAQQKKAKKM